MPTPLTALKVTKTANAQAITLFQMYLCKIYFSMLYWSFCISIDFLFNKVFKTVKLLVSFVVCMDFF